MTDGISNTWRDFFKDEYLISYGDAILELNDYLEVLQQEGYKDIVIPSRGAYPFYRLAELVSLYCIKCHKSLSKKEEFFKKLAIRNYIILPFSADPISDNQNSIAIRKFWVKVLAAMIQQDVTSPYLKFYRFLIEEVAKESWNHLVKIVPNKKFVFIDTVISGRAICEIIKGFEEEKLTDFQLILFVHADGEKIEPRYQSILNKYIGLNKCTLIYVENLFTEDKGPGISGVWSTVYPQLMTEIRKKYEWAKDIYGAGSFYHKVSNGPDDKNKPFTFLYGTLKTALFYYIQEKNLFEHTKGTFKDIRSRLSDILVINYKLMKEVSEEGGLPLDKETTKKYSVPRLKKLYGEENFEVEVSSSHLIRVSFSQNKLDELFSIFEENYLSMENVFHDR